jgi:two-component system sensor histidine kinase KdpD
MQKLIAARWHYPVAAIAMAAVVLLLLALGSHANLTTAALVMVVAVMFTALSVGSGPALLNCILGIICLNYFFIPPVHTLTISQPENWIAFFSFVATALTVGQLSSRATQRAEEAEQRRIKIESLYMQLKTAMEQASESEALRKSETLKTALLDAVTHDLRTPLTSIKAAATALLSRSRHDIDAEGERDLLEVIDEETDRLNEFIEGMVEMARIDAGSLANSQAAASLNDILDAALERAEKVLSGHRVEITVADSLPNIVADARAVAEVIFTLLDNAAKYSPPGSLVHLTAGLAESRLRVSVDDEGKGIPAALREQVFQKFFRGVSPAGGKHGFGMGLAIAKGIVEAHEGRIWVEDNPVSTGARVVFTLPLTRGQANHAG